MYTNLLNVSGVRTWPTYFIFNDDGYLRNSPYIDALFVIYLVDKYIFMICFTFVKMPLFQLHIGATLIQGLVLRVYLIGLV